MGSRNISIVNANIDTVAIAIRQFIKQKNFSCREGKRQETSILAENPCKSFIRLLFTRQPQIVLFTLSKAAEDRTKIEIEFKRFPNFAVRLYLMLALFVIFTSLLAHFPGGELLTFAAIIFSYLFLAVYEARDGTATFFHSFYRYLSDEMIAPITHLQTPLAILRILTEIGAFCILLILALHPERVFFAQLASSSALLWFLLFAFLLLSLAGLHFFLLRKHPQISIRTMFLLPGITLSGMLLLFLNLPLLSTAIFDSHASVRICLFGLAVMFAVISLMFLSQSLMPLSIARLMSKYPPDVSGSLFFNAMTDKSWMTPCRIIVFLLWLTILAGNIFGFYTAASIACRLFSGREQILPSHCAEEFVKNVGRSTIELFGQNGTVYAKLFLLAYLFPVILFVLFMTFRFLRTFVRRTSFFFSREENTVERLKVDSLLEPICKYARIRLPIVIMMDSCVDPNAESRFIGLPVCRNALVISTETVCALKEEKLIALLAHEVGHMKQHTLAYMLQNSISELSFFGSGFLNAFSSSFEIEYEADRFAVEYLQSQGLSTSPLIDLLELLKLEDERDCEDQIRMLTESGTLNFSMLFNRRYNSALLEINDNSGYIKKVILSLKLFWQMCFGGKVISYFHPPIEERIKRVKEFSHAE